jgi:DNA-binding NarL/FixJ family response regulator
LLPDRKGIKGQRQAVPEEELESIRTQSAGGSPVPDLSSILTHAHLEGDDAPNERDRPSPQTTHKVLLQNALISVAVIDGHSFTRESITRSLQYLCNLLKIESFATSNECVESTRNYDVILYHAHESVADQNNNDDWLISIKNLLPIAPVIILCDVDSYDSIRAAFDSGVRGYIPTSSTTLELAIEIMYLVKKGGTFVPPSSLSPRRTKPRATPDAITAQQFTPRQMAVLDRLKLGKPNKIIAYELEMSESSVKTHIQNIMKKMNATNRTEVATRAQELELVAVNEVSPTNDQRRNVLMPENRIAVQTLPLKGPAYGEQLVSHARAGAKN